MAPKNKKSKEDKPPISHSADQAKRPPGTGQLVSTNAQENWLGAEHGGVTNMHEGETPPYAQKKTILIPTNFDTQGAHEEYFRAGQVLLMPFNAQPIHVVNVPRGWQYTVICPDITFGELKAQLTSSAWDLLIETADPQFNVLLSTESPATLEQRVLEYLRSAGGVQAARLVVDTWRNLKARCDGRGKAGQ